METKNRSKLFRFCVNKETHYVYGVNLRHAQVKLKSKLAKTTGVYFITDAQMQVGRDWSRVSIN